MMENRNSEHRFSGMSRRAQLRRDTRGWRPKPTLHSPQSYLAMFAQWVHLGKGSELTIDRGSFPPLQSKWKVTMPTPPSYSSPCLMLYQEVGEDGR